MRYVIAYDISRDDVRSRVAAVLASWGDRIQRSVFECTLDPEELAEVVAQVAAVIDVRTDSIHAVPVCANCQDGRQVLGQASVPSDDPFWIV